MKIKALIIGSLSLLVASTVFAGATTSSSTPQRMTVKKADVRVIQKQAQQSSRKISRAVTKVRDAKTKKAAMGLKRVLDKISKNSNKRADKTLLMQYDRAFNNLLKAPGGNAKGPITKTFQCRADAKGCQSECKGEGKKFCGCGAAFLGCLVFG